MYPVGQPAEAVTLQGRYEGYPGQPGVTTVAQHTTVNIPAKSPQDYIIWSFCCFVYMNPSCPGLVALIFSIKPALQTTVELIAMYPVGQPAEAVTLQGRYEGYPGQPGVTTVAQHTTVNIPAEPPRDHIIWSLCNFIYSNPCCLGLVALIFSIKARDRKVVGDLDGARYYASTARCFNIGATVLIFISIFIATVVITVVTSQAAHRYNSYNQYNGYNYRG